MFSGAWNFNIFSNILFIRLMILKIKLIHVNLSHTFSKIYSYIAVTNPHVTPIFQLNG